MLITGRDARGHARWLAGVAVAAALALAAYGGAARLQGGRHPGGGSYLGLAFGIAAGLIFLFELALLVRKKWKRRRCGPPVRGWMRAHIWLGLFCVPLVLGHAGPLRVPPVGLPLVLEGVFFAVIASGVWGLYLQNRLPRRLRTEVPSETILPLGAVGLQRDALSIAHLIDEVCGWPPDGALASDAVGYPPDGPRVRDRVAPDPDRPAAVVPGAEPLRRFFRTRACEYVLRGRVADPGLASPTEAGVEFERLAREVPAAAALVRRLERLCTSRREFDRQAELDHQLQCWRIAHVPLSVFLVALTVAHIITALRYW